MLKKVLLFLTLLAVALAGRKSLKLNQEGENQLQEINLSRFLKASEHSDNSSSSNATNSSGKEDKKSHEKNNSTNSTSKKEERHNASETKKE